METLIKVDIIKEEGFTVFKFEGELDETNADKTFDNLYKKIEETISQKNIFDFEKLNYMNSKTIGYLVDIYSNIDEAEGEMYIRNCTGGIKDTLNFTGVDTIIPYI